MNLKIIKVILGFVLSITFLFFGVNYYLDNKQEKLKQNIVEQIDKTFDGRNVVMDYTFYSAEVEKDVVPNIKPLLISTIDKQPIYPEGYESFKDVKYFFRLKRGAFNLIVGEKKDDNIFSVYRIIASDFGYKVSRYDGWGYDQWPSVDNCYGGALKYFLEDDPKLKNSFVTGKYEQISNLKYIENEYYQVVDRYGVGSSWQKGKGANINNYFWKVFYTETGNDYIVRIKDNVRVIDFIKYFSIGLAIIGILSFIFLYKPKKIESQVKDNTQVSNNNDSIDNQKSNEYEI